MKIIEEHKTAGKMEEARISGMKPRSLHFKQFLLALKLENQWLQIVHCIEEMQL